MTFGEKIKKARNNMNFSQDDLLLLINNEVDELYPVDKFEKLNKSLKISSKSTISNWENNLNRPDADTIGIIARLLDIDANYLLGIKKDYNSSMEEKEYDEFEGVHFSFKEGYTIDDLSEEDKALLKATINSIKRNIDKELDK